MAFKKHAAAKETEFKYEVIKDYGDLGEPNSNGVVKKFRYVSFNGNDPQYDIRAWKENEDGSERMYKGVSLTGEECEALLKLMLKVSNEED